MVTKARIAAEDRITIDLLDRLDLPEDNSLRYEIIAGELHVSSAPHYGHQLITNVFAFALTAWSRESGTGQVLPGPGVVFAPDDAAQPDLVWISRERFAEAVSEDPEDGRLYAAPELVIEILSRGSQNTRRDREDKFAMYSRHRVREYWIVDWRLRTVDVFRHDGERLRLIITLTADDSLTSPLLPGFSAVVGELCALPT
jgi:Uma2 family endonuclease